MVVWLIGMAAAVFIVDITIKQSIEEQMDMKEERDILSDRIQIRRVHNKGAAFQFMDKYPEAVKWTSIALGALIITYDAILLCRKKHRIEKIGMMLLTGGACSNIFDRIIRGHVVDYFGFNTRWKGFSRITFNLGDFFIMLGATIVAICRALKRS